MAEDNLTDVVANGLAVQTGTADETQSASGGYEIYVAGNKTDRAVLENLFLGELGEKARVFFGRNEVLVGASRERHTEFDNWTCLPPMIGVTFGDSKREVGKFEGEAFACLYVGDEIDRVIIDGLPSRYSLVRALNELYDSVQHGRPRLLDRPKVSAIEERPAYSTTADIQTTTRN